LWKCLRDTDDHGAKLVKTNHTQQLVAKFQVHFSVLYHLDPINNEACDSAEAASKRIKSGADVELPNLIMKHHQLVNGLLKQGKAIGNKLAIIVASRQPISDQVHLKWHILIRVGEHKS
jgi:type I site-specific restriction endonuclease